MKRTAKTAKRKAIKEPGTGQRTLSIRQPWAWLIVNGHKDIENRVWRTHIRGRILIHAGGKPVTRDAYDEFEQECCKRKIKSYPNRNAFELGGVVGSVELVDCTKASRSYWFHGPFGFVLKNACRSRYHEVKGKLGFFRVNLKKGT